ncbi:MAG: aromatic ring-hydroxylating dioxygenase subunit alpha [Planctomycetes bacterium]|nr:aromatic ring-hydroxylating dioxygenase subunit alpha [Planctomycetota bacterium]
MDARPLVIDPDITRASTLPGSFYTDTDRFERSRERVFARSWQWALDARELDGPGAHRPLALLPGVLDEPLVFTRDEAGVLACLSNVCTHRANAIVAAPGRSRALVCRYHGRRFDLAGRVQSMPCFEGVQGFPAPSDDLARVPHAELGPLAFVSAAPEHAFERLIAPVRERVGWLPLDAFTPAPERSRAYEFDAHWALYCDNYLEGFHIPFLHGGLNAVIEFESYTTELFELATLQIARSKPDEPAFDLPASSPEHGERIGAYYFWLWPNLMLNFYPWGLSLNHVQPLGVARTRVVFQSWIWKPELCDRGAGSGLHTVELEDEEAVVAVQRGVRSRFYSAGRYSPAQEAGVHHFHRLLAERLA